MKTYKVGVFEEQGGYLTVKAENPKQAEQLALDHVDEFGFREGIETTHRDTSIVDGAKEVKA